MITPERRPREAELRRERAASWHSAIVAHAMRLDRERETYTVHLTEKGQALAAELAREPRDG